MTDIFEQTISAPPEWAVSIARTKLGFALKPVRRPFWMQLVEANPPVSQEMLEEMAKAQVFLFAWDFYQAFRGETNFGGSFSLPYNNCVFEFELAQPKRSTARYAAWFLQSHEGNLFCYLFGKPIEKSQWSFIGLFRFHDGRWFAATTHGVDASAGMFSWAAFEFIFEQVASAMVALNSNVAFAAKRGPSPELQKSRRRRGKSPLPDYYVVDLPTRNESGPSSRGGYETKLRAHWRRRHTHRFWSQGELVTKIIGPFRVGDEALGSVDKLYRLVPPENGETR